MLTIQTLSLRHKFISNLIRGGMIWMLFAPQGSMAQSGIEDLQRIGLQQMHTQPDSALANFEKARELASASGDEKQEALSLNRMGVVEKNQGKYFEALKHLRESLQIRARLVDSAGMASVQSNLGSLFRGMGNLDSALHFTLLSLELRGKLGNDEKLANSYINLGNLYALRGDWAMAKPSYKQALAIATDLQLEGVEALAVYNLGKVHTEQGELRQARVFFERSLTLEQGLRKERNVARSMTALGVLAERGGDLDRAKEYYQQALDVYLYLGVDADLPGAFLNLGNVAMARDQWTVAQENFEQSLRWARDLNQWDEQRSALNGLNALAQHADDWEHSARYLESLLLVNDSIALRQSNARFEQVLLGYEREKHERETALQKSTIRQKEMERNALLLGALGLLVTLIAVFLVFRQRLNTSQLVTAQSQLQAQQKITDLMKSHEIQSLETMLQVQTEERQRISRDLHDQLGGLLATIKLHFSGLEERLPGFSATEQQRFEKANRMLDLACVEARTLAHNMASGMLGEFGLVGALKELQSSLDMAAHRQVKLYLHGLEDRLDQALEMDVYRMVLELLGNAVKHANAQELSLQINRTAQNLNIMVEDDGVGFSMHKIDTGQGIGLKNTQARVQKYGGKMDIDSRPGHGTTIVIDLPLSEE